eukprot:1151892-Pelagomonas_calceolata.AAC.5
MCSSQSFRSEVQAWHKPKALWIPIKNLGRAGHRGGVQEGLLAEACLSILLTLPHIGSAQSAGHFTAVLKGLASEGPLIHYAHFQAVIN